MRDTSPGHTLAGPVVLKQSRVRGGGTELMLSHGPSAAPVARRAVVSDVTNTLDDHDLADSVAVVVSELVGNAILHANPLADGGVSVRWQVRAGVVDLEVTDGGSPDQVRPARRSQGATTGRGLRIVRHLADEWGVVLDDTGRRTVWAALGGPSRRRHPLS